MLATQSYTCKEMSGFLSPVFLYVFQTDPLDLQLDTEDKHVFLG